MIGTLAQMASTQSNNIYTHKVKRHENKAAFENIIRSAAATMLGVFESLRFEETGHFESFTTDKIVLQ